MRSLLIDRNQRQIANLICEPTFRQQNRELLRRGFLSGSFHCFRSLGKNAIWGVKSWGSFGLVRLPAIGCGRLRHPHLRHHCTPICATLGDRLRVVLGGHLQVVFVGDFGGVSEPRGDHVQRERARQFGLACGTQILEQPRPWLSENTASTQ